MAPSGAAKALDRVVPRLGRLRILVLRGDPAFFQSHGGQRDLLVRLFHPLFRLEQVCFWCFSVCVLLYFCLLLLFLLFFVSCWLVSVVFWPALVEGDGGQRDLLVQPLTDAPLPGSEL